MGIDFSIFLSELMTNPMLLLAAFVNIAVIAVNGATDAPNAITTVVSTRCLSARSAVIMAAACNFAGLLIITLISSAVANTIFKMVDFGGDSQAALVALLAAMAAITVWATVAWYFGIPTSESHALIAGLTGAAIALQGGFDAVNGSEWVKVLYGILLSTFMGFGLGFLVSKVVMKICKGLNRTKLNSFFRGAQIVAGAGVAFMHGAQDGQKFMSIFMLAIMLALGASGVENMELPMWLMALCALCMGVGTAIGGKKIIKSVGMDMVKLEKHQGFAAALSATACLLIATFSGLPVSTTHTATTAIMGVGAAKNIRTVKWQLAGDMVKTWLLTFPGCGLLGFAMAKLFLFFV